MSAREDAVEALRKNNNFSPGSGLEDLNDPEPVLREQADVVSDVWDPLLREAYTALERSMPREGDSDWHQGVLRRLREALAL